MSLTNFFPGMAGGDNISIETDISRHCKFVKTFSSGSRKIASHSNVCKDVQPSRIA